MKKYTQYVRSMIYVTIFTLISMSLFVMMICHLISDRATLILQLGVIIVAAPLYFFTKGDADHPWGYCATTAISYAFLGAVSYFVARHTLSYWNMMSFYVLLGLLSFFWTLVIVLDISVMLIRKLHRRLH